MFGAIVAPNAEGVKVKKGGVLLYPTDVWELINSFCYDGALKHTF